MDSTWEQQAMFVGQQWTDHIWIIKSYNNIINIGDYWCRQYWAIMYNVYQYLNVLKTITTIFCYILYNIRQYSGRYDSIFGNTR